MMLRKTDPSSSACSRPACVRTPPCFMMSVASIGTSSPLGRLEGPKMMGLICTLRLMPEKWRISFDFRSSTSLTMASRSTRSNASCSLARGSSLASEPARWPSRAMRSSTLLTQSSTSCNCCGVLSFACFPGPLLYLASSARNSGSRTGIFIFCLGVRSPWRITATTHRSSSYSSSSIPSAKSSSTGDPRSFPSPDSSYARSGRFGMPEHADKRNGATALRIIVRSNPAASS
mmetsp:Transcript_15098/g.49514  ORF Transcript_15098/g.49514 Transcript_15098/m.49514 type:complete len:232 (+) Transcript_15098:108-803(+)